MILLKTFDKRYKKINVDGRDFLCVIDYYFKNEFVVFRVYPERTKTSFFEVRFTWQESWHFNLNLPETCSILIKYAIGIGWVCNLDKQQMIIRQGDFLRKLIELPD